MRKGHLKNAFKRQVKKGEKGIKIFAPNRSGKHCLCSLQPFWDRKMTHILKKYSLDELMILRICKSEEKQGIVEELRRMKDYSEAEIQGIISALITKIEELSEEELKKVQEFIIDL